MGAKKRRFTLFWKKIKNQRKYYKEKNQKNKMKTVTLGKLHKDLLSLRKEVKEIKLYVKEEFELSDWAKKELKKARAESKTISHDEIMKKYTA